MGPGSEVRRGVALGGFMGAGKSTVGRALAERLGLPFVDTDAVLVERHGPVAEQFARDGEAAFRVRERALLDEVVDGPPAVVALGGGILADAEAARLLRAWSWVLHLDVALDQARRRVGQGSGRPLWDGAVAARHAARRPRYAAHAHATLDADAPLAEVIGQAAQWVGLARDVPVPLPGRAYPVSVRAGLDGLGAALARAGRRRAVLVTEETVGPLWSAAALDALRPHVAVPAPVVLPAGEAHKTVATWSRAVDGLLAAGVDRGTAVIALGGGVLGDLAGFAAATVLRGVPLVQVPTTVLAMVDSSVGGKTAVDHPAGKNLIGAFHQPERVWIALETLSTLPAREVRAGLAEVVKIALIADADLFAVLERDAGALADGRVEALAPVVARAVALKAGIVVDDEREAGIRAVLNLGHTLGHAVEQAAGYGVLRHGEAVAIGMLAEARWAARRGTCPGDVPRRLEALLADLGLPTDLPAVDRAALARAVGVDKKRDGAMLTVPLPTRVGAAVLEHVATDTFLDAVLGAP